MCLCYPRKSGLIRKFNHLTPVYLISYLKILVYLIFTKISKSYGQSYEKTTLQGCL